MGLAYENLHANLQNYPVLYVKNKPYIEHLGTRLITGDSGPSHPPGSHPEVV